MSPIGFKLKTERQTYLQCFFFSNNGITNPNSAEAHYEMGKSLWGMGKWQEAEPHVRQAVTINQDFPLSHVLMGNIYLRHRDGLAALRNSMSICASTQRARTWKR